MFKKLKQRIEDDQQQQPPKHLILASTPKKNNNSNSSSSAVSDSNNKGRKYNTHHIVNSSSTHFNRENKWEKRRRSNPSLYSSRESLLSVDSSATATVSRISYGESSCSIGTPVESPINIGTFRDIASKEEVLTELTKKNEQVKRLENKVNDMAVAYKEQSRERDRLEEALMNFRNEMHNRTETSINDSLRVVKEEYETKLLSKERQLKDRTLKHNEELQRLTDVNELNSLQQNEVNRMKTMLIHSQTEMSRKTAELLEKTKQIENLDKQYTEQKLDLEGLQDRLNEISRDRSKYESQEKHLSSKVTSLEKEKSALKSQLTALIDELTQKSSQLESVQLSSDRSHEETSALRQTYNLYKAKATADKEERDHEITVLKERNSDLEQRLSDSKLCGTDQLKAVEKERSLLERRLQDTREQLSDFRTQSNDKISTLGSLVSTLDEKVKEGEEAYSKLLTEQQAQNKHYEAKISDLNDQLTLAEKKTQSFQTDSSELNNLHTKIKELEQKCSCLKNEKLELEILADKSTFLESQNKLLDTRFKETVDRLEADRTSLEEKVRELQSETRKSSYRQEHTNKRKMEQLETKVEDLNRRIYQYQERMEELVEEKDTICAELVMKDEECKEASKCLEDAMSKTNELKKEMAQLEMALKEKDNLLTCIKEESIHEHGDTSMDSLLRDELSSAREMFHAREQDLVDRDDEIEELRRVIRDRDDELATVSKKLLEFEENNKIDSPRGRRINSVSNEKELQKTIARLTQKIHELEQQPMKQPSKGENTEVENRTLMAELNEANQKIKGLQHMNNELKKQVIKEMKQMNSSQSSIDSGKSASDKTELDYLQVNFKYLKHVVLKYMCSTNDQSRQLVGVIGHLLQFSSRESSIVRDCFDWKLPLEK